MTIPSHSRRSALKAVFACLAFLIFSVPAVRAGHDHKHITVTLIDYLGFQKKSEHYVIEVKEVFKGKVYYYHLSFTSAKARGFKGHEGESMEISLSNDGRTWARARLHGHKTVPIHSKVLSR